ncbi:MAG TPA: TauD/TfdA family dioxygenase [Candidatus Sulfotelmatobacter sp.]
MPLPAPRSSVFAEPNPLELRPFDWDGPQLQARGAEWIIDIEPEIMQSDLRSFLSQNSVRWQHWTDLGCPESLKPVGSRLQELVLKQTGIALVKCGLQCTPDMARLLQLILGCEFGLNVTTTPESDDRPLFALEAVQDPTVRGMYSGNGLRGNAIGFHTDGSGSTDRSVDLLSLLCIRPARFGGQSRVANAQQAYNSLPSAAKDVLAEAFPRENPFAPGVTGALKVGPIFCGVERYGVSYFHFSYHPQRVRNGSRCDMERFSATIGTLQMLDEALERFSCDINLMTNEILFVNNSAIAHDRRAFIDDPQAKRQLERFWAGTFTKAAVRGEGHGEYGVRACVGI